MLYCEVLCYAMLCDAMQCYAMLRYAALRYVMLRYAVPCCTMLCYAVLVVVHSINRHLPVLGVRGPVQHEAGRRPEQGTLEPTALVSTDDDDRM